MSEKPSPLVSVSIFVLMLVLTRQAIGFVMPPPPYFREKLEYFEETKDEYDLIFVGASDMHWGISPSAFDDQLSRHGVRMRSYNLAVMASSGYETDHMIRWALSKQPERLKYVVISWRAWALDAGEGIHEREIWWHSLTETILLLRGLMFESIPPVEKLAMGRIHGLHALRRFVHLGLGPGLASYLVHPAQREENRRELNALRRGFQPLTEDTVAEVWSNGPQRRRDFLQSTDAYLESVAELAGEAGRSRENRRAEVDPYLALVMPRLVYSVRAQMDFLDRHGVYPINVLAPTNDSGNIPRRLMSEGYIRKLMTFDDPGEYPDLFELPNRFDDTHLNETGAELYSRHMADRFAEFLESNAPEDLPTDRAAQ